MSHVDPAAIGAEIESLIEKIGALGDAQTATQARELVRLLLSLYGAGLSRMLDIIRTEEGGPHAVLDRLAADPLVGSLLVLHDLHPHPLGMRVEGALSGLRPHLPEHVRLTLVAADGESVRVNVDRSAAGQTPSSDVIRVAIERAVREAAPELSTIQIDGLDAPLIQILRAAPTPSAARPIDR